MRARALRLPLGQKAASHGVEEEEEKVEEDEEEEKVEEEQKGTKLESRGWQPTWLEG